MCICDNPNAVKQSAQIKKEIADRAKAQQAIKQQQVKDRTEVNK